MSASDDAAASRSKYPSKDGVLDMIALLSEESESNPTLDDDDRSPATGNSSSRVRNSGRRERISYDDPADSEEQEESDDSLPGSRRRARRLNRSPDQTAPVRAAVKRRVRRRGRYSYKAFKKEQTMDDMIAEAAASYGVNEDFLKAVLKLENPGLDPEAISPTGAIGLGQITTPALDEYNTGTRSNLSKEDLTDPKTNLNVTAWYLVWVARVLLGTSDLSWLSDDERAIIYAGYNVGVGTAKRLLNGDFGPSTQRYVSLQARSLSKDGAAGYLTNVRKELEIA